MLLAEAGPRCCLSLSIRRIVLAVPYVSRRRGFVSVSTGVLNPYPDSYYFFCIRPVLSALLGVCQPRRLRRQVCGCGVAK